MIAKRKLSVSVLLAAGLALDLPAEEVWDKIALGRTPRAFEVELPCSNDCGRVEGVRPVFVEGEPLAGRETRVFAWIGLPKGASAGRKVPGMVLVHGGGGTAFASWVRTWNDRGYAAIAMDTCGGIPRGERDGRPHPRHPWSGPAGWCESLCQIEDPIRDQWTYHAVAAVMRCHSYLRSLPEVDATRIGLTGISWGGYLACIVGSVDDRFRFSAPVYGCGYYELNPEWHRVFGGDSERLAKWFEEWDPKRFLGEARIPFLWCCGTNDRWYPLDALNASIARLGGNARLNLSLKLRMHHAHPPAGDPPEIAAIADALLRDGRPLADVTARLEGDVLKGRVDTHGRGVRRVELLYTCSTNALLMAREWKVAAAERPDAEGRFAARVPSGAVMFFVNAITDDGLVASSRVLTRQPKSGGESLSATPESRTQRLHDAKWGVFNHFLGNGCKSAAEWNAKVDGLNVEKIADQLQSCGAKFYFFTVMQGTQYLAAPNATYDRIAGVKPGEACSRRDLPADLAKALGSRGIDLYLYYTGDGPYKDAVIGGRFGFAVPRAGGVKRPFVEKWASVLEEYAVRYGANVKGWWIDGCYARDFKYTDELLSLYAEAVRRGNPAALVAMNDGVKADYTKYYAKEDFTSGEFIDFCAVPRSRFINGAQAFMLAPLGLPPPGASKWDSWCKPGCKRDAQYMAEFVDRVNRNGGVVAIDINLHPDGSFDSDQLDVLKAIGLKTGTLKASRGSEARHR